MAEDVRLTTAIRHDGTTYENILDIEGVSVERATPSIPAAKVGSLTTRTDNDTGVLTMNSGHGFTTGNKVDVFWDGGSRRAMDATVATNAVTVDGGSGDNLPVLNTAITAMVPVDVPFVVDGDEDLKAIAAYSPVPGYVVFFDDEGTPAAIAAATYEVDLTTSGLWADGNGVTNPLAGEITTSVKFSHGSTSAQTMKAIAVFGSQP